MNGTDGKHGVALTTGAGVLEQGRPPVPRRSDDLPLNDEAGA